MQLKLVLVLLAWLCYSSSSSATEVISTDVYVTDKVPADYSGGTFSYGSCPKGMTNANLLTGDTHNWGSGDAIQWGACYDTFAITEAINQALSVTGISIDSISYNWKWINGCFNVTKEDGTTIYCNTDIENRLDDNFKPTGEYADQFDTLVIDVIITDSQGNTVETKTYDYDTWFSWYQDNAHSQNEIRIGESVWQITEDTIELYDHTTRTGTIYTPDALGSITFKAASVDNGNWSGYYGPVVQGGEMWFNYRMNPCTLDAAYDSSCPGYADAYAQNLFDQQCAQNPQYDSSCPGYVQITSEPATIVEAATSTGNSVVDAVIATPELIIVEPIEIEPIVVNIPTIDSIIVETVIIETPVDIAEVNLEQSLEIEIEAELEAEIAQEPIIEEIVIEEPEEDTTKILEDTQPDDDDTSEKPEEKGDEDAQDNDEKSEENESTGNDEEETEGDVESQEETDEDKEESTETTESSEEVEKPKEEIQKKRVLKKSEKNKRMRELVAEKVLEATKKLEEATTLEQQKKLQETIIALIAFVPDFKDYGIDIDGGNVPVLPFYPDVPTVDHGFSRWFLNDSGFAILEDLQYN